MKIALVTDGIAPYVLGGMQRHSYFICKYLAANGHQVDLYHTNQSDKDINALEVFTEEEKKNIRSFVIPQPKKYKFPGHYLYESYLYSCAVYDVLKNNLAVDFIYTKGFSGWKLINEKRKHVFPPIAIKFHGLNMFQVLPDGLKNELEAMMFRPVVKKLILNADYNFSYGGKITEITKKVGVTENKILEVPTGITNDWLKEPEYREGPTRFIYIGRYERLKGIQEINKAIEQLANDKFEFHFVGPIPKEVQINSDKVIYHGETRDLNIVRQHLDNCDVLLCPSYSEGMPNAVIEAMSRGLSVIATDVGAVNVMLDNSNGWLLDACTVEGIGNAMKQAIQIDKKMLLVKKKDCYNKVKSDLIWDCIYNTLIQKIESVVLKKN